MATNDRSKSALSTNNEKAITLLGTPTEYLQHYAPHLLESLPRSLSRDKINITSDNLPFSGFDVWTAFELSWLNGKGKPVVAIGEFIIPATSTSLIESKSFKLYLNSLNQTRFQNNAEVIATLEKDLTHAAGGTVTVKIYPDFIGYPHDIMTLPGKLIDQLDISVEHYDFSADYLRNAIASPSEWVSETLSSNLLKSNCLITNQPDWGSVVITYEGHKIDEECLLRYIISFRNHNEFHEQCVERIFNDIKYYCHPDKLMVFARYTRRGGLDINPLRSDFAVTPPTVQRLVRQ